MSRQEGASLQTEIETRLAATEPDVEVLLAEVVSPATLRLFIDHPGEYRSLCASGSRGF